MTPHPLAIVAGMAAAWLVLYVVSRVVLAVLSRRARKPTAAGFTLDHPALDFDRDLACYTCRAAERAGAPVPQSCVWCDRFRAFDALESVQRDGSEVVALAAVDAWTRGDLERVHELAADVAAGAVRVELGGELLEFPEPDVDESGWVDKAFSDGPGTTYHPAGVGFSFDSSLKLVEVSDLPRHAGLRAGDQVLSIDGHAVVGPLDLLSRLATAWRVRGGWRSVSVGIADGSGESIVCIRERATPDA